MYYDNDNKLTLDQIQKITDLQNNYINIFKINNYSLEQIKFYMCENFKQYKEISCKIFYYLLLFYFGFVNCLSKFEQFSLWNV